MVHAMTHPNPNPNPNPYLAVDHAVGDVHLLRVQVLVVHRTHHLYGGAALAHGDGGGGSRGDVIGPTLAKGGRGARRGEAADRVVLARDAELLSEIVDVGAWVGLGWGLGSVSGVRCPVSGVRCPV